MTLAIGAIRTAISEVLEGEIGTGIESGVFERGVFDGQPDEATLAKLRQTSTATHWFDVTVGEHENHPSSAFSARLGHRRIVSLPVTIDIYTGLATEVQESDRSTLLASIASDCEDARQALGVPGNLDETFAEVATNIVGGLMRGVSYAGLPDLERIEEDWKRRIVHSQIRGAIVCVDGELEEPIVVVGDPGMLDFSDPDNAIWIPLV